GGVGGGRASEAILVGRPEARVLGRARAGGSCRGGRSRRGRRPCACPRPPQAGPIATRYASAPRDLWNGACPFCRAGFASRGTAVARAASATCSSPCPRPKKSWVALLGRTDVEAAGAVAERTASADVAGTAGRPWRGLAPLAPRSLAIRCERSRSRERGGGTGRRGLQGFSVCPGGPGRCLR